MHACEMITKPESSVKESVTLNDDDLAIIHFWLTGENLKGIHQE